MKTIILTFLRKSAVAAGRILLVLLFFNCLLVTGQTLAPGFVEAGYTLTDLGGIDQLPPQYGGLTIKPEEPNTLYIGGNANLSNGMLYSVPLLRESVTNHITGFGGQAVPFISAPNIDGGVCFTSGGTILFTRYNMNELGQILPDNSYVSTSLTQFGVASSVGSMAFVPAGYPGAGSLIFSSYNGSTLYNVPYTIDGSGQYFLSNQVAAEDVYTTATGPEGIAYIPGGSAGFQNLSMVISSYGLGSVVVFEVGENGLPVTSTARDMVTGLTGAEGALIDPVTGDFLFSTFGGGNKVIRITGFEKPSAIGDEPEMHSLKFNIFPNPTKGPVRLKLDENVAGGHLEVFNTSGKMILQQEISGTDVTGIDLSLQPDGLYLIRVNAGDQTGSLRILKK